MNEIVLVSTISRVTVYRDGALVERTATLVNPGTDEITHITIGDLPACLDDGSVRLSFQPRGEDPSAPIAQDFKVSLVAAERQYQDDSAESLRNEMTSVNRELDRLRFDVDQLNSSIDRISSVSMPERPQPGDSSDSTPNPTDARLCLSLFLADRREQLTEDRHQLSDRREEMEERLAHLQNRLEEMHEEIDPSPGEIRKAVHLQLRTEDGQAAGDAELRLVYLIPGAHWYPSYSLYAAGGADDVLAMHAYVAQHSGEDWTGVTLRLSTAEAQQWTELPNLHSLRIGKRQPIPARKGWRSAPAGAELLFADYDRFKGRMQSKLDTLPAVESVVRDEDLDDEFPLEDVEYSMAEEEAPFKEADSRQEIFKSARAPAKKLRRAMVPDEPDIERELMATAEPEGRFLNYHELRLPEPDEPGRGKLQAAVRDDASRRLHSLVSETYTLAMAFADPLFATELPESYDGFDFVYECVTPVDVSSRQDFTYVPVLQQVITLKRRYVTVPREGPEVFRMATVGNPLDNPLLAGPMDIYLEGEFFVSAYLKVVAPRGKTEIGLGVEQGVKVARNTVFTESRDGGLLGGNLVLRHELAIELINNLQHEIDIQVRERVPVTADGEDDIRIEKVHVVPEWTDFTGEIPSNRGGYVWDLTVPAGGKRQLKAEYRVKISAKNELVDGNRREVQ